MIKYFFIIRVRIVILISIVLLSINCIYCQNQSGRIIIDPEPNIAKEINTRKIVMIGEQPHGHPSGYKEIIKILYEWFDVSEKTEFPSRTLNLVLEMEDSLAFEINKYFLSGDLTPILNRFSVGLRYEEVEFYNNLKEFYDKLIENNSKNGKEKYRFKVLGFENVGIYVPPAFLKKSNYQTQLWFINERDSILSQRMANYINANAEDKYLFFYGTLHLLKGLINKNFLGFDISEDSCMGHFLGGYLKERYGNDSVLTVGRGSAPDEFYKNEDYELLKDKTFLIRSSELDEYVQNASRLDYFMFSPVANISDHIFNLVYCKNIFEQSINTLKYYETYFPSYNAVTFSKRMLRKLSSLTGCVFKNVHELELWYKNKQTLNLNYFDSEEYKNNIFGIYSNNANDKTIKNDLVCLGFDNSFYNYTSLDTIEWNRQIWPESIKNVKIINAIGILWVGNPDEIKEAKEYLKNISGKDYTEPKEYLMWWRNVFHNFGI